MDFIYSAPSNVPGYFRLFEKMFGGGVQPQKTQKNPNPKWDFKLILGFLGFFGFFGFFLEKGVESTFLNIPDHLRPTCFLHFFREISPSSDT